MTKLNSHIVSIVAIAGLVLSALYLAPQAGGAGTTARPGAPAPGFTARDIAGQAVSLSNYVGKTVILEWTNNGCPFVGKHYNSGNMQALQRRFTAAGDIWLTIASSAPGEEGYVTPDEARADLARWKAAPSGFLLDPDGVVGHLYDARATPHMVVIDRTGRTRRRENCEKLRRRRARRTCGGQTGDDLGDARLWVQRQIQDELRRPVQGGAQRARLGVNQGHDPPPRRLDGYLRTSLWSCGEWYRRELQSRSE